MYLSFRIVSKVVQGLKIVLTDSENPQGPARSQGLAVYKAEEGVLFKVAQGLEIVLTDSENPQGPSRSQGLAVYKAE